MTFFTWSTTEASNANADATINWAEGQAPSSVNNSARAMMAAAAKYRKDMGGVTTGGSSTVYTLVSTQVFSSLANMNLNSFVIIPHTTNGAAPTLNVDGLGAKALNASTGVAVASGALLAGTPYLVTYFNATSEFILVGFVGALNGATISGAVVATQAQQETASATNVVVTPGRQQFHPSACKAWVRFQGADGAVNASYNCTVTRNAVGDYTVLFDTDMSTANFAGFASCSGVGGAGAIVVMDRTAAGADAAPSSAGQRFSTYSISGFGAVDPTRVYYAAFGDQ